MCMGRDTKNESEPRGSGMRIPFNGRDFVLSCRCTLDWDRDLDHLYRSNLPILNVAIALESCGFSIVGSPRSKFGECFYSCYTYLQTVDRFSCAVLEGSRGWLLAVGCEMCL